MTRGRAARTRKPRAPKPGSVLERLEAGEAHAVLQRLLAAHPDLRTEAEQAARSGHSESLFTPVKRLRTRDGFGRSGTGCSEYRHLERTCRHVLLLVGLSEEVAAQELKALVDDLRSPEELSPAEREGMLGWCGNWRDDFNADARACEILADAMRASRCT